MHIKNLGRPLDNKLLAALPRDQFDLLAPNLSAVPLQQGDVLAEPGDEFDHVYLPHFMSGSGTYRKCTTKHDVR